VHVSWIARNFAWTSLISACKPFSFCSSKVRVSRIVGILSFTHVIRCVIWSQPTRENQENMVKHPRGQGSVFGGSTVVRRCRGCSSLLLSAAQCRRPICVVCTVCAARLPLTAQRVIHAFHLGDSYACKERYRLLSDLVHSDYLQHYRSMLSWRRWRERHGFPVMSSPRLPPRLALCMPATRQHVEGCSVGELERCRSLFKQEHNTYLARLQ